MSEWEAELWGPKPQPPPTSAPTAPIVIPTEAHARYAARALEGEVAAVDAAIIPTATHGGTRNTTLNTAAFSMGQLVGAGVIDEATVCNALAAAARRRQMNEADIARILPRAVREGAQQPRQLPQSTASPKAAPPGVNTATGEIEPSEADAAQIMPASPEYVAENMPQLDWHALWADDTEEEWIVEPIMPARRLIALYSAPKVGKSLLMLEVAAAVATGRPIFGVTPEPRHVLYVDFENDPRADIRERLQAMNYGPDDLARLHYLSFPTMRALDTDLGSQELMAAVELHSADVVFIDTVSRAVSGEENENDTWLKFYRYTGLKLKQAGVAAMRLDHSGKDETKGQRGGSAKVGDVDAVWRMSRVTETKFRLECEAHRFPLTESTLIVDRKLGPLRHEVDTGGAASARDARIAQVIDTLDALGVEKDTPRDDVRALLKPHGVKFSNSQWPAIHERWTNPYGGASWLQGEVS